MLDFKGNAAAPRTVTIVGEWAGGSFDDVLCGREYMNEEDANGNFFDGLLFTTADRKIGFGSSSRYLKADNKLKYSWLRPFF